MRKTASIIAALVLSFAGLLRADTSYLLIQGPFGSGGALETIKFAINYTPGTLSSGFDLLTAALTSADVYTSTATSEQYRYSTEYGNPFTFGFKLGTDGTVVENGPWTMNPDWSGYGYTWSYYTAEAADGAWSYSYSGITDRTLSNGSYDGWVFGYSEYDSEGATVAIATIDGAANVPTAADFADATVVEAVPEPGSIALVLAGGTAVLALRRKFRKAQ